MSLGFQWEVFVVKIVGLIIVEKKHGSKNRAARPLFDGGTRQRTHRYVQKRLQ